MATDNELDLAAWQPPPPPPGIADGVIARMHAAAHVAAVDARNRSHRRWVALGGVLAAVAAIVAIALWGLQRVPHDGHGDVVATLPQRLELEGTTVDLDAGAELHWRREGGTLAVTLPRGTTRWTVGDEDQLRIDAAVASIEATGASLRVEVQMNLSDARIMGASALTAAAVAMVTVVVYEGHVKATSGGQTVNVAPGGSVELRPDLPPSEPPVVGASNPEVERLVAQIKAMQSQIDQLKISVASPDDRNNIKAACYEARAQQKWQELESCAQRLTTLGAPEGKELAAVAVAEQRAELALHDLATAVGEGDRKAALAARAKISDDSTYAALAQQMLAHLPGPKVIKLDADDIEQMAEVAHDKFLACNTMAFDGKVVVTISVAPKGSITKAELAGGPDALQTCIRKVVIAQHLKASTNGGTFRFSIGLAGNTPSPCATIDIDEVLKAAQNQFSAGYAGAALKLVQKTIACKPDLHMIRTAALYACRAHDANAARLYYNKLPEQYQPQIVQACQQETPPIKLP